MQLAQGLFQDITGGAEHWLQPSNDERRSFPRVSIGLRGTMQLKDGPLGARPLTVMVRDISREGVGLLSSDEVAPGKVFLLNLRPKDDNAVSLSCVVTRCQRGGLGESHFVLGARFQTVSEVDVQTSIMN